MSDFPMMLYRAGDEFIWDGVSVETLTVSDAVEMEAAFKDGWGHGVSAMQQAFADIPDGAEPAKRRGRPRKAAA